MVEFINGNTTAIIFLVAFIALFIKIPKIELPIWAWILRGIGEQASKPLMDRITKLDDKIQLVKDGTMEAMCNRLKYLCKCYIKAGHIDLDDYEDLKRMHEAYKKLGGNGFVDKLMAKVGELPND